MLDCVLLGFGPDEHTASLFPDHHLMREDVLLIASIVDSPKLPKECITLAMRMLNERSRDVIFVGAGASKALILSSVFQNVHLIPANGGCVEEEEGDGNGNNQCVGFLKPTKEIREDLPCGLVRPTNESLVYITNSAGAANLELDAAPYQSSLL